MEYTKPELVLVGRAASLVLGDQPVGTDGGGNTFNRPEMGLQLGLDD